jgi:hypothetical protein
VKWVRVHSPHSLAGLYWSQDTPTVVHQNQWFRSAWRAQRCVCVWGGGGSLWAAFAHRPTRRFSDLRPIWLCYSAKEPSRTMSRAAIRAAEPTRNPSFNRADA